MLPTPVFTSPSSTVVALFAAEAPGVAQSGSPIGAIVFKYSDEMNELDTSE